MYDIVIIGAGPGGYVAGIRAAQLGLKVCVIEKDKPGGVCLNVGCIPTKNLIHQAGMFASQHELTKLGIKIDTKDFDFKKVISNSKKAVKTLVQGVEYLLKKNKVELISGTARITSPNSVALDDGKEIHGKNILIATGSRSIELPGFEFDEKQVLSSTGVLNMEKLPKSMIILGAGAIGCEFAYIMNAFGVKVHLVEMVDQILPFEDEETVSILHDSFTQKGIQILTKTKALALEKTKSSVNVTLEDKEGVQQQLKAQKVLCVFGRKANIENLGLENIGIETDKGCIKVGDYFQTSVKSVFAIGDMLATPQLAHVASKEGEIAVEYIAGADPEPMIDLNGIVSAIYCEPQIASFGLREEQAKEQGINYEKAVFPYVGIGKAVAIGKTEGKVKVLFDPDTKEIQGAHMVGASATELIHEILLAKSTELLPEVIAGMVHAHPTLSEAVMEAMRAVTGTAIHY